MAAENDKLRHIGQHGVVTLPTEVDVTNTDEIRQALLSAASPDVAVLIIDMSGTTFCDSAGWARLWPPTGRSQRPGPSSGSSPPQCCTTMVRHHAEVYDAALAGQSPAQRQLIEATLAGLRFVRNQAGSEADLAEFIQAAAPGPGAGHGRITGWRWKPVPLPVLASLPPRAQAWR
jgi:hypothetical protein